MYATIFYHSWAGAVVVCFNTDQLHREQRKPFSRCGGASRNVSRRAGVMDVTPSNVVVKAGLRNLLLWIYCHLRGRHNNIRHTLTLILLIYSDLRPLVLSSSLIWDTRDHPSRRGRVRKVENQHSPVLLTTFLQRSSSFQTLRMYFPGDTSVMSIHWQSMSAL